MSITSSVVAFFDETAVFRRTATGRQKLLSSFGSMSAAAESFLGMINGYTDLRTLMRLGFPASEARSVIEELLREGAIELVSRQDRR